MGDETLELSDVESFSYLMKCLWDKDHIKREHMAILDTIVYKDGRPFRWIFTNNEGFVVKKRDENITPNEVLRVFKQRAKTMNGSKHHSLINKIALVWYVDSRNNIQSHLLDDVQLKSFLEDNIYECLAVQLYIGGFPLKGSGVFQHRFWLRVDNSVGHETTELVSSARPDLSIYMENTNKLTISDTQHTTLKKLAKRVIKLLERNMSGTVASMVLQVAFSSSWTPFVVAAKSMLFWGADSRLALYRQASLFVCDPPQPPSGGSHGSIFLPHTIDQGSAHQHGMPLTLPYRESVKTPGKLAEGVDATTGENLFDVMIDAPNTEGKKHGQHHNHHGHGSGGGEEDKRKKQGPDSTLHDVLHSFGQELELDHGRHHKLAEGAFNVPTSSSHAVGPGLDSHGRHAALQGGSTHKYEAASDAKRDSNGIPEPNFKQHPVTGDFVQKARSKYNDDDLLFIENKKNTAKGKNDRFYNGSAQRPLGASDAGPHYPQDLGSPSSPQPDTTLVGDQGAGAWKPGKGSTVQKELRTRQSAAMSRLSTPASGSLDNATLRRLRTVRPGQKRGAIHSHPAYGQTESSRTRLEFYASQLRHVDSLPVDQFLNNRRAISAPHGVRRGRGGIPTDGTGMSTTITPGRRGAKVLGGHGKEAGGRRSSGFERPAPLQSGTVCYGDYCFLGEAEQESSTSGGGDKNAAGITVNYAESALSSSGIQPAAASNSQEAQGIKSSKLHDPSYRGGVPHSRATSSPAASAPPTSGDTFDEGGIEAGMSALDMGSVAEREGEGGRTDGGSSFKSSLGKADSPSKGEGNPFKHEDKVHPHDLQPPILPYQLPFRSVLLLRAEENHLKTKIYEPWEFDGSVMESKAALDMKAQEFKIMDHNRRLLNLTQRHLRRIAYSCLSDVRKAVTSTPNTHTAGSGFTYQWQQLSIAYRKLVYADALSKTHPSRFYQTVPMCECCQFIYSMADAYREEVVFGGHQPPSSPTHSPGKGRTRANTDGSPGKHTNGIDEARQKGIERRERADAVGSFRSSRHSNRLPTSLDGHGQVKNEDYDRIFDGCDFYSSDNGGAKEIGYLNTLAEKYPVEAEEETDTNPKATEPDGRISAWVRMLTDNTAIDRDRGDRASTAPAGATRSVTPEDRGKPNPMGPLAGQGVGNPLGQYRGLAAPVGYMLGQPAGDVGTKTIDENGNFIYQKKRSPAEVHLMQGGGDEAGQGGSVVGRRPASASERGPRKRMSGSSLDKAEGSGIAFPKNAQRTSSKATGRPATTDAGSRPSRLRSTSNANEGYGESKSSSTGNLHSLVDIDQYEFKSSRASQLFGRGTKGTRQPIVKAATTRTPVPMPISMSSAYGEQASKVPSNKPVSMEDYRFTSLPGTDAPLIPLTAYHVDTVGTGVNASLDGIDAMLPTYQGGGTSFEAMLLQTHTMAEAHKAGHKRYSKRRPASGSALGFISGRRREIMESKQKAAAEFEEVAARGYLGGMDMPKHALEVRDIYSEEPSKRSAKK